MGKTAGTTRNVSVTGPHPAHQPYLDDVMREAAALYHGRVPTFYPGPTVAGFTPSEVEGQYALQQAARDIAAISGGPVRTALETALSAPSLVNTPYFEPYVTAVVRPLYTNLTEQVLPEIRSAATSAGQPGSSREGIATGLAIERTQRAAADAAAKLAADAYSQGLSTMTNALSLAPSVYSGLERPGFLLSGIGAQERALEQARINEAIARHEFEQTQPYRSLVEYANIVRYPYGGRSEAEVVGSAPPDALQKVGVGAGLASLLLWLYRMLSKG